jgi:two-component system sensor histidine kinase BaeS
VIRAAVESLTESGRDDEDTFAKCTEMLDRHVNRLEQVTMDLLDLHAVESAGRSPLQVESIEPAKLGEWIEAQFAIRAQDKGVTLDVNVETSGGRPFCSDRKLLEMILQNLVANAVKFTPSDGRVECKLNFDGRELTVRVADTGCGIKSEDQPRVFERFFQADRSRTGDTAVRGSGLGLAIVKHAAERLRASVDLQSTLGEGTTITVIVPNRRRAGEEAPPPGED